MCQIYSKIYLGASTASQASLLGLLDDVEEDTILFVGAVVCSARAVSIVTADVVTSLRLIKR